MKGQITISKEAFKSMVRIRKEMDSLVETIEIMNNKELMKGIKKSKKDLKRGKVHKLKNIGIDEW